MASLALDIRLARGGFLLEVSETIPLDGVTALFGPSGSGKSTLLDVIAGHERRAVGRVAFGAQIWQEAGRFVPPHRRGVGMVFQDARLFGHLDVRGNLGFAARRARRAGLAPDEARVVGALDLGPLLDRRPGDLSGGERQRVALGRALLSVPRLLLLDEPLAALDEARKAEILPYLERLSDTAGVPVIHVSHSVAEVARLASRVAVLSAGRVSRIGAAAEVLSDPGAVPMIGLREAGAVLVARVVAHHADGLSELAARGGRLLLPRVAAAVGARLRVRILAQDVILARGRPEGLSALNVLAATVTDLRPGQGPGVMVQLDAGGDRLLARITRRSASALGLGPGTACFAVLKAVSVAPADIGQDAAPADIGSC